MFFSVSLASTILLAGGVLAQYGGGYNYDSDSAGSQSGGSAGDSGSSSMSSSSVMPASTAAANVATPSGQVMVHVVKVSNKKGDLTFEPNNLQVPAGHMVQFHFYPKNHSIVQSTFDQPCEPINNNNASVAGFFSGFMPVKEDATMMPSYTIMVNDTKPIWYYCSQGRHCQAKMVGVINPPAANKSRTIESFGELASRATENLSPGQSSSGTSSSSSSSSSSSGSGSDGSGNYGSSGSDSSSSNAAAPAASDSTSSGTITTPLTGTNSSTTNGGAAAPSGSAGGQGPAPFTGSAIALGSNVLLSLGVSAAAGFVLVAFL